MLTVVEVGKNVGKSADCNRRFWMGSASVKRIMFIILIFYFFFSFMFAILLFSSGKEYVSLFRPEMFIREHASPSLLPSQFRLISSVILRS